VSTDVNVDGGNDFHEEKVIKLYAAKPGRQLRLAIYLILFGSLGLLPVKSFLDWYAGGPAPHAVSFVISALLLLIPIGILIAINALRGLPRVAVTREGIKLQSTLRTKWARWDSLEPFAIMAFGKTPVAKAKIIGPNVRKGALSQRRFRIPDYFTTPLVTIVAELNAARAQALGLSAPTFAAAELQSDAASSDEATVGLAEFKLPWLSFALLAVLIAIFVLENVLAVTPSANLIPSIPTLFALGGFSRSAVLSQGEWYRLFTAPLLHANIPHILGNGVALLFGGWVFERLVGRLWFFAIFVIGALGGSLLSLAVAPPQLISVGASGALMGIFAALLVSSFRLPKRTATRRRLQMNSLRVLVPSLVPRAAISRLPMPNGQGMNSLAARSCFRPMGRDTPARCGVPARARRGPTAACSNLRRRARPPKLRRR
jgi:membrane associated rhomboid family serine protease